MDPIEGSENTHMAEPRKSISIQMLIKGRWVLIFNETHGLVGRLIMPRYGRLMPNEEAKQLVQPLLKLVTGREKVDKLILLLTPSNKLKLSRKLHCFDRDTTEYLCSTCVTQHELELMRRFEGLFKYDLFSTDQCFPFESLASDSSIIQRIVEQHRATQHANIVPVPPKIKSLCMPKIPVRLRRSDVNRIKRKEAGDDGEPRWKL